MHLPEQDRVPLPSLTRSADFAATIIREEGIFELQPEISQFLMQYDLLNSFNSQLSGFGQHLHMVDGLESAAQNSYMSGIGIGLYITQDMYASDGVIEFGGEVIKFRQSLDQQIDEASKEEFILDTALRGIQENPEIEEQLETISRGVSATDELRFMAKLGIGLVLELTRRAHEELGKVAINKALATIEAGRFDWDEALRTHFPEFDL